MNQWVENLYINYRNIDTDFKMTDFFVHSHDYFEIYQFHRGDCNYVINDETFHLKENDVVLMNGSTLHGPLPKEGTPYERTVIEFRQDWVQPILKNMNVPDLLSPFKKQSNLLLRNINQDIIEELDDVMAKLNLRKFNRLNKVHSKAEKRIIEGEETLLFLQLLFIIYKLSKNHSEQRILTTKCNNDHVSKIISWIDGNYSQHFSLDDIAENLHLSKYYLSRIFKEATGLTVMEYVIQRRLMRAKHLLEFQPNKSIMEIALETGFESAAHFSRRFRKHLQITPSDYRNVSAVYDAVKENTF